MSAKQSMAQKRRWARKREQNRAAMLILAPNANGVIRIPLTQGKFALIDAMDLRKVVNYKWYACRCGNTFYAFTHIRLPDRRETTLQMHRLLLNPQSDMGCDHINGNGLDNRRENLRLASHAENIRNQRQRKDNSTGYKGVSFEKNRKKFTAQIQFNRKRYRLGCFLTAEAAHAAYCEAANNLHGKFARMK